jgi:hypothetical protein
VVTVVDYINVPHRPVDIDVDYIDALHRLVDIFDRLRPQHSIGLST